MIKKIIPALFCVLFVFLFNACDIFYGEIDEKFRGKWEITNIFYDGKTITLPGHFSEKLEIDSAGFDIKTTSISLFHNFIDPEAETTDLISIREGFSNIYTEGNTFFDSYGYASFTMIINGNTAIITWIDSGGLIHTVKKVPEFSWETTD